MGYGELYPHHQLAVVICSANYAKERPAIAKGFMRACIKAVRDCNPAILDGKLAGPGPDEIVSIPMEYTPIKNPNAHRTLVACGVNPDGRLNVESRRKDLDYFKEQGMIQGAVSVEQAVDTSFVEAALPVPGPYEKGG